MVSAIGSANNLINMISSSYQQNKSSARTMEVQAPPPPPPPPTGGSNKASGGPDPLGIFDTVDSDSDGSISEEEYNILTEGIQEVTGTEFNTNFLDFDTDGDGALNGSELRSVLDAAGFVKPPPPPQQVIEAYSAQSDSGSGDQSGDNDLLVELLEYLKNRPDGLSVLA